MNQYNSEWVKLLSTQPHGLRGSPLEGRGSVISPPQEEGRMAAPNGQSGGFIDLKELKINVLPSNEKVKKIVRIKTVAQPSEDVGAQFKSLNQTKKAVPAVVPTHKLPTVLPAPTLGSAEKTPVLVKEASRQKTQPSKTFIDGPQLPSFDAKAEEFGVQLRKDPNKAFSFQLDLPYEVPKPASAYTEGEIKFTTKQALKQMIQDIPKLNCKVTTGCIIDETCDPEFNTYKEGAHFLVDELMGNGSYGTVDLCYDSKTRKPFIRKQLKKKDLRTSEVIVPTTLSHRNVTKFFGLIQKSDEEGNPIIELLLEFAGCALNKYILEVGNLPPAQIWDLSKQGLEALAHISHYSIIHLDVKPENMCVTRTLNGSLLMKLTDFGSSRLPQEPLKFAGVTPEYMAPEMCMMFLQTQRPGLSWGLTEADITGKVDTFAFALVIMYLYKKYHILVKLINNGKTSYEGVDVSTRKLLHMKLMTMMVDNSSRHGLVQTLIPDECDLDMRDLLVKLTEHNHKDRFSAREGLNFIDRLDQGNKVTVRTEQKVRVRQEQKVRVRQEQKNVNPYVPIIALDSTCEMEIPEIAEDCMERDNGPVKNRTKDALRQKLQPYGKSGKKGKNGKSLNSGKTFTAKESVSEMWQLKQGIASKQIPMTPIDELEALNLGQCPKPVLESNTKSAVTDRKAPVAQPSMDTAGCPSQVSQPVMPAPCFNSVNFPQMFGQSFGLRGINMSQLQQHAPTSSSTIPCQQLENNVVSLGGKGIPQTAGVTLLNIPQELIQRWLLQKAAEQANKVQPNVFSQIPATPKEQPVKIGQTKNIATFGDSPVQMEADDDGGDDGNLPKFSMFV